MASRAPNAAVEAELAAEISQARAERRTITGRRGLLDLDAAYRIQRARHRDQHIVGRKIGMVSPAKLAQFGYSAPVHGPATAEMLLDGPVVDLAVFLQPRLEPELAVVLRDDVAADARPGDVARAVPGLFLAIDILDTVWDGYGFEPPEAVADGVNGGGFLLGEQLLPLDVDGELRLHLDGALIAAGPVAELGDPVARIAWLAGEVGGLRAGDAIFLGSPAANVPATPGTLTLEGPRCSLLVAELKGSA